MVERLIPFQTNLRTTIHTEKIPHVVVLGGGFAGRAAVRALRGPLRQGRCRVSMVDRNPFTTMTPALPDVASGRIGERYVTESIERLLPQGVVFHAAAVTGVDLAARRVQTTSGALHFDFLILAMGSTASPPASGWPAGASYPLAALDDAIALRDAFFTYLDRTEAPGIIISGAGYTGVELAVALALAARRKGAARCVSVLERRGEILPFLNERRRGRVLRVLERHGVQLRTRCRVVRIDGRAIELSTGERCEDAFLCRAEGTCAPLKPDGAGVDCWPDGRLCVDAGLALPAYPHVFAAGDAAAIPRGDGSLRKAVNFAIHSGARAGANIALALRGRPARAFRPVDLGWVIPMIDDSVGRALGVLPLDGRAGCLLHYAMCGVRNFNGRNFLFFLRYALKQLGRVEA